MVITDRYGQEKFYLTPQELFESLLLTLYGKSKFFGGDMYGAVFVSDKPAENWQSPDEVTPR